MTIRRKIRRAVDGDTLQTYRKLGGTNYIRLAGVNYPEKGQSGYGAAKAKMDKLRNKVVTLVPKAKDKYGRIVADVRYKRRKIK